MLRVHVVAPSAGALQPLLALKGKRSSQGGAAGSRPAVPTAQRLDSKSSGASSGGEEAADGDDGSGGHSSDIQDGSEEGGPPKRHGKPQQQGAGSDQGSEDRSESPDLHNQLQSR